jgi:dTDP-4-amino-4,6-dideoxygalactose transaminase
MTTATRIVSANPKASYLACRDAVRSAVMDVLENGSYILGSQVASFEDEFATYVGTEHAVGVGNGTDALQVALRGCGVKPGECVATVSHTAVATVAAIQLAGALPVLVDVDPVTYTMDPAHLETTLRKDESRRIRAVIPVHLYGHPCDLTAILDIAHRYGLQVIEDCAQSHGALIGTRQTGTFGRVGAFSFYPTKNLGAFGDGGACVCNDPDLALKIRLLRQYGWQERYLSEFYGMNTRLDEMQAAILRVKLPALDAANTRRREIASMYAAQLGEADFVLPVERANTRHVYHQYVIRTPNRDALREFLLQRGVVTSVLYPRPVHLQPAYLHCVEIGAGGLVTTERLCREILSLPLYPELTDDEVEIVCRLILEARCALRRS